MGTREPGHLAGTFDAGALIALERGNVAITQVLRLVDELHIPAGALAQVWRDPSRQVRLARLTAADGTTIHPLDADAAKAAGALCALTGTTDVIDASVAQVARMAGGTLYTSDPDDLRRIAPDLRIAAV